MRQRSQNPPLRSWAGFIGPWSVWRKGSPMLQEGDFQSLLIQVFSLNPLVFFILLAIYPLGLLPMVLLRLLNLLQGLHQLYQASHLQWKAECLEAEGLQKIEFVVARSKGEDLYNVLKVARIPGPSLSGDPPSSKGHRHMPSAMVRTQQPKKCEASASDLTTQEYEGVCQNRGPSFACLPPHWSQYSRWDGMHPCQYQWHQEVYCCWAEGCSEGPSTSHAAICTHMCSMPSWV